jgi:diguanylate cyclase (GGDEF)-like protein
VSGTDDGVDAAYARVVSIADRHALPEACIDGLRVLVPGAIVAYVWPDHGRVLRWTNETGASIEDGVTRLRLESEHGSVDELDAPFPELGGWYAMVPVEREGERFGWLYVCADTLPDALLARLEAFAAFVGLVAQHLRVMERERAAALTDVLTGIPNRRALELIVRERLEGGMPFSYVLFDLNDLKKINDSGGGHAAGDAAIRTFAQALAASARQSDYVARLAGDEFVGLLAGTNAKPFIARVRERLDAAGLKTSAGVACFPEHGATLEALYAYADLRLYESKIETKAPARVVPIVPIRRRASVS